MADGRVSARARVSGDACGRECMQGAEALRAAKTKKKNIGRMASRRALGAAGDFAQSVFRTGPRRDGIVAWTWGRFVRRALSIR